MTPGGDRLRVCSKCDGLCRMCVLDLVEWPPRDQDEIARAEAAGPAKWLTGTPAGEPAAGGCGQLRLFAP